MDSPAKASVLSRFRAVELSFRQEFCVPFLLDAQNQNGGWGYSPGADSRVEPTCWAIRALENVPLRSPDILSVARHYLLSNQLRDGSWPASPALRRGSWVTSLACSVLSDQENSKAAVSAGLRWLCEDYPRDSAPWRILLRKLFRSGSYSQQDDTLRGWGWTPRTSSWVEPTAFALLALRECPTAFHPSNASERRALGRALLYDRVCPGGGWNCGNPLVYGVPGEPLVLPTSWALLALEDQPPNAKKAASLAWLQRAYPQILSPASRAVSRMALEAYGLPVAIDSQSLDSLFGARNFLRMTIVVSWACLALTPERLWFPPKGRSS